MPKRLQHTNSPGADTGHMRVVYNARRARLLHKRGVDLTRYDNGMRGPYGPHRFWVWWESADSYNERQRTNRSKSVLGRAIREARKAGGLDWVRHLLTGLHLRDRDRYVMNIPALELYNMEGYETSKPFESTMTGFSDDGPFVGLDHDIEIDPT